MERASLFEQSLPDCAAKDGGSNPPALTKSIFPEYNILSRKTISNRDKPVSYSAAASSMSRV
jgi:hypothetical protein